MMRLPSFRYVAARDLAEATAALADDPAVLITLTRLSRPWRSLPTRAFISRAALLVKVTAVMWRGAMPHLSIR